MNNISLDKKLEYSHLKLDLDNVDFNSLRKLLDGYKTVEDYLYILKIIRDPKNFYFTLRYIFNLEVDQFQIAILQELWNRPYPLFIASRGASKSFLLGLYALMRATITQGSKVVIVSASFRQSKNVFDYAENILEKAPILKDILEGAHYVVHGPDVHHMQIGDSFIKAIPIGTSGDKVRGLRSTHLLVDERQCLMPYTLTETDRGLMRIEDTFKHPDILINNKDGVYEKPSHFIKTTLSDVYKIILDKGFTIECSDKHKLLTFRGFEIAKDLKIGQKIPFDNKYKFPTEQVQEVDEDLAWLFGMWISEGYINNKDSMGISMTDLDCIDRIHKALSKKFPNIYISRYEKEGYIDKRFKNECKKSYQIAISNIEIRNKLESLGLSRNIAYDKKTPWSILQSPRNIVIRYLAGLFEGDGTAYLKTKHGKIKNKLNIAYYTVSKQLANEVLILLTKLGYSASLSTRNSKLSNNIQYLVRLNNNIETVKFAEELNIPKWAPLLEKCYRSKKDRFGKRNYLKVKSIEKLPDQQVLYDFTLPETHSFYANGLVNHNSIPEEVYEVVIGGFGSVTMSPMENVKKMAKVDLLKEMGLWTPEHEKKLYAQDKPNQTVLSGTGSWGFTDFAKLAKRWKDIVNSRGDKEKLFQIFGAEPGPAFDYKDFSVIKLPYDLIPKGFMDAKHIEKAKNTVHIGRFQAEYNACFPMDSDGFYKRTLIESCTTKREIILPSGPVQFRGTTVGDRNRKYVYGIDPASESDNFAIVILELHSDHRRVVCCWTATRKKNIDRGKNEGETDFYQFIARKIRSFMKVFPCAHIALDSQGGGIAIMEALHNLKSLEEGELPIWPILEDHPLFYPGSKNYGYDDEAGLKLIEMVSFSKTEYVVEANHGMKQDMESKVLLFPSFNPLELGLSEMEDKSVGRKVDTQEEVVIEIEELKEELSTISHLTTQTGKDKWDTPETVLIGNRKGRLRKDRYSALLMANMAARRMNRPTTIEYQKTPAGGAAYHLGKFPTPNTTDKFYSGPDWYVNAQGVNFNNWGLGSPMGGGR